MSYNRTELKAQLIELAQKQKPHFIDELVSLSSISRASFYRLFPKGSQDYEDILEELTRNRVDTKRKIKQILLQSTRATELLPVYKLLATDEEKKALSSQYIQQENTSKDSELDSMTLEEQKARIKELVLKGVSSIELTDEELEAHRRNK